MTDQQAERMADAYNLGIKAEALREFATDLEGVPHYPAAILARKKAEVLDDQAETLATTDAPAAPAAEPTEAQKPDLEGVWVTNDGDGPWLTCHRCDELLVEVESGDWLTQLVVLARQHACPKPADTPAQDGEQAEDGQ